MTESDAPIDLLLGTAFPQLAVALRNSAARSMGRWQSLVREVLPRADELTFSQLRDDLPNVLEQVAKALEVEGTRPVDKLHTISAAHGEYRFEQHYNLNEVLMEYDLLRPIVIEEVMRELKRPLSMQETVALNAGMDICARRSVISFVDHQSSELRAASEAQSKYLSFLSHDLRGGLNGVFLMTEVLKRELEGEEKLAGTLEDLDSMRRSLLETVATMDRFLHAERFRKGKVQVQPVRLDLKSLMNELVSQISYQAKDKGLALERNVDEKCIVQSDRELVSMVIQNLLSNAVKYTKSGTIRLTGKPKAEGGALLAVSDDGPGMEPERLNNLFLPFSRGQTYGQPGVGLGLSIARQAADLLKGKLWAESTAGKGSIFYLELPADLKVEAHRA